MIRHGLFNISAAGIRMMLSIITVPLLIRTIGVDEYGLWSLASAVVGIVALAEAGLSFTTTVFVSRDLASNDMNDLSVTLSVTTVSIVVLATIGAVILLLAAPAFIASMSALKETQIASVRTTFQIGGAVVWTRLLQQVLAGIEQSYGRYDVMNLLNTVQAAGATIGLLLVAWLGGRSVAMMTWMALLGMIMLALHGVFCANFVHSSNLRFRWNWKKFKEVVQYSALTWLTNLGSVMFGQVDRIIVGGLLGAATLGIYSAITNITAQINLLSSLPVQPLLPRVSGLLASADTSSSNLPSLNRTLRNAFAINIFAALGIGVTLIVAAPQVLQLMLRGLSTPEILVAFRYAVVIYTLYSLNAVGYYLLFALSAVWLNLVVVLISGGLSLMLIAALADRFGLVGAIIGNLGYALTLLLVPLALWQFNLVARRHEMLSSKALI